MVLPSAHKFRKKLDRTFHKVEKGKVVWGNIPPAFVYRCRKK
jgi:phospholipid N-methyltransferase